MKWPLPGLCRVRQAAARHVPLERYPELGCSEVDCHQGVSYWLRRLACRDILMMSVLINVTHNDVLSRSVRSAMIAAVSPSRSKGATHHTSRRVQGSKLSNIFPVPGAGSHASAPTAKIKIKQISTLHHCLICSVTDVLNVGVNAVLEALQFHPIRPLNGASLLQVFKSCGKKMSGTPPTGSQLLWTSATWCRVQRGVLNFPSAEPPTCWARPEVLRKGLFCGFPWCTGPRTASSDEFCFLLDPGLCVSR